MCHSFFKAECLACTAPVIPASYFSVPFLLLPFILLITGTGTSSEDWESWVSILFHSLISG